MKSMFQVNGKPFFSLGGQVSNSSAYTREDLQPAIKAIEQLGMNTIAAPVYWECLEPEEGKYCFDQVDGILAEAEAHNLKVVLLWFGTWKNGNSHYVPRWVKEDRVRFPGSYSPSGKPTASLSPLGKETFEKDRAAFCQLMAHIKEKNQNERVLAVQVENEPGQIGTPRDCSPMAEEVFSAPVPAEVTEWLQTLCGGEVWKAWQKAGARTEGNWRAVFGYEAAELFSAYHFCKYINGIAEAGKAVYNLPLYINVWLQGSSCLTPGLHYPSGGATTLALDLWKKFGTALDLIAPDIYAENAGGYDYFCDIYSREDNLLYIPESWSWGISGENMIRAIEKYHLTSVHTFGVDMAVDPDGTLQERSYGVRDAVSIIKNMMPLIEKYHGTDKLFTVTQSAGTQWIDMGDYIGQVDYYSSTNVPEMRVDCFHSLKEEAKKRAMGIIINEGNGSFYVAGCGFRLSLFKKTTPEELIDAISCQPFIATRNVWYLDAVEGVFDAEGQFIPHRRRNGDETDFGVWTTIDVGVVHVQLG